MSASELAALGPDPRAARDFFPEERLARWLTELWLVEEGTVEWTGYIFEGDLHSSLGPEIRMT
jgi:hypothetical protein